MHPVAFSASNKMMIMSVALLVCHISFIQKWNANAIIHFNTFINDCFYEICMSFYFLRPDKLYKFKVRLGSIYMGKIVHW